MSTNRTNSAREISRRAGWSDERTELLKKLHKQGLSCSQIARELGGVTRNAVISKVSRLGLGMSRGARRATQALSNVTREGGSPFGFKPSTKSDGGPAAIRKRLDGVAATIAARAEPFPERAEPPGLCTTISVGAHQCRWPIGDPQLETFTVCGKRTDRLYCETHHQRAFQPPAARARVDERLAGLARWRA